MGILNPHFLAVLQQISNFWRLLDAVAMILCGDPEPPLSGSGTTNFKLLLEIARRSGGDSVRDPEPPLSGRGGPNVHALFTAVLL